MTKRRRATRARTGKRRKRRTRPALVTELASRQIGLVELPAGPIATSKSCSLEAQAARLSDPALQAVQRQALAAQIGRVGGNGHLQRVVASLKQDEKRDLGSIGAPKPPRATAPSSVSKVRPRPTGVEKTQVGKHKLHFGAYYVQTLKSSGGSLEGIHVTEKVKTVKDDFRTGLPDVKLGKNKAIVDKKGTVGDKIWLSFGAIAPSVSRLRRSKKPGESLLGDKVSHQELYYWDNRKPRGWKKFVDLKIKVSLYDLPGLVVTTHHNGVMAKSEGFTPFRPRSEEKRQLLDVDGNQASQIQTVQRQATAAPKSKPGWWERTKKWVKGKLGRTKPGPAKAKKVKVARTKPTRRITGQGGTGFSNIIATIEAKKADLVDPSRSFEPIWKGKIVKRNAWLRDENKLSRFEKDEEGKKIPIPRGTEVTIVASRQRRYYYVTWNGDAGWTHRGNVGGKRKLTLPKGTRVKIVMEVRGKNDKWYSKVKWDDKEGWTKRANIAKFDLTYATTFGEGDKKAKARLLGSKTRRLRYEKEAKESFISSKEARGLDKILGSIKRTAYTIDPQTGKPLKSKLRRGIIVVVLGTRTHKKGDKEKTAARVMDLTGKECWTWMRHIRFRSPRIYKGGVIHGSILESIKKEKVKRALQSVYGKKMEALLKRKRFTLAQKELLKKAKEFVQNRQLQSGYPELEIPAKARQEDGIKLNADLIRRINTFYKFLVAEGLIDGLVPGKGISGVRSYARAHELSTRWTLNPKQGYLRSFKNKKKFVSQLVHIGGRDRNAAVTWASGNQMKVLKKLVQTLDKPEAKKYVTELLKTLGKPKTKKGAKAKIGKIVGQIHQEYGTDGGQTKGLRKLLGALSNPKTKGRAQAEMEEIIGQIQKKHAKAEIEKIVGQIQKKHGTQGAMAAEGYPKGSLDRYPNIRKRPGISLHCGGEAIDVYFNFRFNYYDPIVDAIALVFGLRRSVKDSSISPEHWHYERVGVPMGERMPGKEGRAVEKESGG